MIHILKMDWEANNRKFLWEANEDLSICETALDRLFDLPLPRPKTIWISLHERPSKWRVPALVDKCGRGKDKYPILRITPPDPNENPIIYEHEIVDKLLNPIIGKTIYIQVEYEDA